MKRKPKLRDPRHLRKSHPKPMPRKEVKIGMRLKKKQPLELKLPTAARELTGKADIMERPTDGNLIIVIPLKWLARVLKAPLVTWVIAKTLADLIK